MHSAPAPRRRTAPDGCLPLATNLRRIVTRVVRGTTCPHALTPLHKPRALSFSAFFVLPLFVQMPPTNRKANAPKPSTINKPKPKASAIDKPKPKRGNHHEKDTLLKNIIDLLGIGEGVAQYKAADRLVEYVAEHRSELEDTKTMMAEGLVKTADWLVDCQRITVCLCVQVVIHRALWRGGLFGMGTGRCLTGWLDCAAALRRQRSRTQRRASTALSTCRWVVLCMLLQAGLSLLSFVPPNRVFSRPCWGAQS